jgi:pimeloyl-ACP methyl ester carboxylesterase
MQDRTQVPLVFQKSVVLMGHSFGSGLSHGLATKAPEAADAIMLTAYLPVDTYWSVPIIISA